MTVQHVKQGMLLILTDSGQNSAIQALEDARFTVKNGPPDSWCEFDAVDVLTQQRFLVGAAHPPQGWAPGLQLIGWACKLA